MTEREQVVAWLRGQAAVVIGNLYADNRQRYDIAIADKDVELIESIANRIERGDHQDQKP